MSDSRLLAPNIITAANIACGFAAMVAAAEGRFEVGVYLLVLAIFLDMSDGAVARWLRATSELGRELDSFSDALSFGAAPAFLLYWSKLHSVPVWGLFAVIVYLLAAVLRLARFNLTTDAHSKDERTFGCPTPIAAGYLMATVLMRDRIDATVALAVVFVFAVLMLSRVSLPNLKGHSLVTLTLLVGIGNYLLVVAYPNWYTVGWWNLWNVVILLTARAHTRRLEPGPVAGGTE